MLTVQLAVIDIAALTDPITDCPWFFAPTPLTLFSFYPDPRVSEV